MHKSIQVIGIGRFDPQNSNIKESSQEIMIAILMCIDDQVLAFSREQKIQPYGWDFQ